MRCRKAGTVSIKTRTRRVRRISATGGCTICNAGAHLVLSVSDTGVGMSRSVMERAFEPFFTTKAPGPGQRPRLEHGLRFRVKQSDGHVEIESEPGGGTTVRIYLPMQVGAVIGAVETQPPLPAPRRGKEVVLVVEDNVDLRGYAVSAVRSFGYRALSAPSAKTALKLLETRPDIALLFTDIVLKDGLTGVQLADMARGGAGRRLRVLLTSGYLGDRAVGERAHQPGTFTIGKPFSRRGSRAKAGGDFRCRSSGCRRSRLRRAGGGCPDIPCTEALIQSPSQFHARSGKAQPPTEHAPMIPPATRSAPVQAFVFYAIGVVSFAVVDAATRLLRVDYDLGSLADHVPDPNPALAGRVRK